MTRGIRYPSVFNSLIPLLQVTNDVSWNILVLLWIALCLIILAVVEPRQVHVHHPSEGHIYGYDDDNPHPKRPGHRKPVYELYHQRFSEQTFIGAHDSVAIRTEDNNWSLSGNQYFNISTQLDSGVRLLQAQGHRDINGTSNIRLCHFNCALLDGGSLTELLYTVLVFLKTNPREVVTLLFVNTGPPLKDWALAYHVTGADVVSYIPPFDKRHGNMQIKDWPTIAEMVESNKRLVTFLSSGADLDRVPYLLPEYDFLFETNFGIEAPDQYTCHPSRPRYSYVPDRLSLVNHFLYARFLGISKSTALIGGAFPAIADRCHPY